MGSLYQPNAGLSPDIVLNFNPYGVSTPDKRIRVPFHRPLTFTDSILQIVNGYVKLISHRITGLVSMTLAYSNSGADHDEPGAAIAVGTRPKPGRPPKKTKTAAAKPGTSAAADAEDDEPRDEDFADAVELHSSQDSNGSGGGRRHRRQTTPQVARGIQGILPPAVGLERRLQTLDTALNRGAGGPKMQQWPMAICLTPEGRIRTRWSCFAMLALTDPELWHHLGYNDSQIYPFEWQGERVFALGPYPIMNGGDVTAVLAPAFNAVSLRESRFHLIPRQTDAILEFYVNVQEIPATPAGMSGVLEMLIAAGNHKYRNAVLEFPSAARFVWPNGATYAPGANTPAYLPLPNMFPIHARYERDGLKLTVNTRQGQGSIRMVYFEQRNPFGFFEHYKTWDTARQRNEQTIIRSEMPLGVRGQQCEITSNDVFLSRATMNPDTSGPALCALFYHTGEPGTVPHPITYFPKNILSSGAAYNALQFRVNSRHLDPVLKVTGELFEYSLILEIRS